MKKIKTVADTVVKTVYKTTASGAPLALQDLYNVKNTHIRQVTFAHSGTFNSSLLLWKKGTELPPVPFAVGVWYQKSHELIPIGVVKTVPSEPISIKEFNRMDTNVCVPQSNINAYIVNRMAEFQKGPKSTLESCFASS